MVEVGHWDSTGVKLTLGQAGKKPKRIVIGDDDGKSEDEAPNNTDVEGAT